MAVQRNNGDGTTVDTIRGDGGGIVSGASKGDITGCNQGHLACIAGVNVAVARQRIARAGATAVSHCANSARCSTRCGGA